MKYLSILLLLGAVACTRKPANHLVIRGTIPGAPDSTVVTLTAEDKSFSQITGHVIDGKFEIRGKVDVPTYCKLGLYDEIGVNGFSRAREIPVFVANGELTFSTPHIDSMPLPEGAWLRDIRKERHYTLKGSKVQDAFYAFQQQTVDLRYDIKRLTSDFFGTKRLDIYKEWQKAEKEFAKISLDFVEKEQELKLKLHVANGLKRYAYTYDQAYLDRLERSFTSYQDTCKGLWDFRKYLKDASAFVKDTPLKDVDVRTVDGKTVSIRTILNKKGYTIIDFWASWCGACRASNPRLQELAKQFGDRISFVSISTDQEDKVWLKAVEEENLPWEQYRTLSTELKPFRLGVKLLPTFLMIDTKGNVVFAGINTGALELWLENL